mgnify:FL=1
MDYICFPAKNHLVIFTEYKYQKLEQITKVTENVTLVGFCNFLFYKTIVKIITKLRRERRRKGCNYHGK